MINRFVSDICKILEIETPIISFDTSTFPSESTLAQCVPSKYEIRIKQYDTPHPDQFFAIAHELRHLWQMQTDPDLYTDSYRQSDECESVTAYNLQLAELDANAFAGVIMEDFFTLKPLFHGLSDEVKEEIYKRMRFLREN